ncbi:hypothetical protein CC2G_009498 [Coprinopsis cinerea AmutBmut pab1-1]|nr:hypothetical protein CC2G_009498 [Coprinopsis cinerea AmutBmut pab1-1]
MIKFIQSRQETGASSKAPLCLDSYPTRTVTVGTLVAFGRQLQMVKGSESKEWDLSYWIEICLSALEVCGSPGEDLPSEAVLYDPLPQKRTVWIKLPVGWLSGGLSAASRVGGRGVKNRVYSIGM